MLNLLLCARCPKGIFEPSETEEDGRMSVLPFVWCDMVGVGLFADSDVPEGCSYSLEHCLTEDDSGDMAYPDEGDV